MNNGIYKDVSIEDYHDDKSHISATQIKWARQSLAHFKWYIENKQEVKTHFDFGNAFELSLLGKEIFNSKVAICETQKWIAMANEGRKEAYADPKKSGVYQDQFKTFKSLHQGKYFINDVGEQSMERIQCMLDSCNKNATIQKLLQGIQYQMSVYWNDPNTDLPMKTRPDICQTKRNVIVNVKTILDGSPENFSRELTKWDYPLQASVEIKGCIESGLMSSVDVYYWLVVEKEPPFNATLYEYEEADRKLVDDDLAFLLMKIKRARDENNYPGYYDRADNKYGILRAKLPPWYKSIY